MCANICVRVYVIVDRRQCSTQVLKSIAMHSGREESWSRGIAYLINDLSALAAGINARWQKLSSGLEEQDNEWLLNMLP